jgi:hypothetical protein
LAPLDGAIAKQIAGFPKPLLQAVLGELRSDVQVDERVSVTPRDVSAPDDQPPNRHDSMLFAVTLAG